MSEREAIVTFLRRRADVHHECAVRQRDAGHKEIASTHVEKWHTYGAAADAIEAGEHEGEAA